MERLPPELCLRVLQLIPSLLTLGQFILSQKYVFCVFSCYRLIILTSVISAQFGHNARHAVFLATGQVSGATCEESRLAVVQQLHAFSWARHQLKSRSLCKLAHIGNVVASLSAIFTDTMAAEFWLQAVDGDPPSIFRNAEQGFKRALYRYWVLCELYAEFSPASRRFFWASSLDRKPFAEFYRPLTRREVLEMAFLEFCFFPRFMVDVCGECERGVCTGELHKLVFRGGPEELLRIRGLHYPERSLSRDDFGPDESLCGPKGLLEDLLHGTDFQPVTPVPGPQGKEFFSWVMFELDGLDEGRRKIVEMVCGELKV